jgi:hypothetical protein
MVTNQIDAEKNTDLISDKGNGLIVLLHGYAFSLTVFFRPSAYNISGPGTGKTLTAERLAILFYYYDTRTYFSQCC